MKKPDLEKYRQLLLAKRRQMLEEMGIMDEKFSSTTKEATGDLSAYSYHMADQGTDAMEREINFMLASKTGRLVYHLDEAIRRIDDGTYGKCFGCGKMISAARLEAVPHARLCIECKSAEEEKKIEKR